MFLSTNDLIRCSLYFFDGLWCAHNKALARRPPNANLLANQHHIETVKIGDMLQIFVVQCNERKADFNYLE